MLAAKSFSWLPVFLLLAVLCSALAVVGSSHYSRRLFAELRYQQRQYEQLHSEWRRLHLEYSTWASAARIERLARQRLQMKAPQAEALLLP